MKKIDIYTDKTTQVAFTKKQKQKNNKNKQTNKQTKNPTTTTKNRGKKIVVCTKTQLLNLYFQIMKEYIVY